MRKFFRVVAMTLGNKEMLRVAMTHGEKEIFRVVSVTQGNKEILRVVAMTQGKEESPEKVLRKLRISLERPQKALRKP